MQLCIPNGLFFDHPSFHYTVLFLFSIVLRRVYSYVVVDCTSSFNYLLGSFNSYDVSAELLSIFTAV